MFTLISFLQLMQAGVCCSRRLFFLFVTLLWENLIIKQNHNIANFTAINLEHKTAIQQQNLDAVVNSKGCIMEMVNTGKGNHFFIFLILLPSSRALQSIISFFLCISYPKSFTTCSLIFFKFNPFRVNLKPLANTLTPHLTA